MCLEVKPKLTPEAYNTALAETEENAPLLPLQPQTLYNEQRRQAGVTLHGKKWATGREISIKFLRGVDAVVASRIREIAEEWTQYANIKFRWAKSVSEPTEVRIGTILDGSSWSFLGIDHLLIKNQEDPTMNFGWLTRDESLTEFRRVVRHEFGHLLARPHEHQHPHRGFEYDRDAVIAKYQGPPNNWSIEDIEHNVLNRYSETQTVFDEFDTTSIMLYPIPNELTIGDFTVGWNTEISAKDRAHAAWQYPFPDAPQPPKPVDPLEGIKRVAASTYLERRMFNEKCVLRYKSTDRALAVPIEEARRV